MNTSKPTSGQAQRHEFEYKLNLRGKPRGIKPFGGANKIIILCLIIGFITPLAKAQNTSQIFKTAFNNNTFNGSALVMQNKNTQYKGSFGYANEEWQIKNQANTKFKLGSCTKQFTAALIMLLHQQGKISLNSTIKDYIPNYPEEHGNKITIHHLLAHESGIPDYFYLPQARPYFYKSSKPLNFLKVFWELPLEFEPGSQAKYSNSGYFILGIIIETVTQMSYEDALNTMIFEPLKMTNSGIDNTSKIYKNKAYGYLKVSGKLQVAPYINSSCAYSAGAIYSTCEDLALWCQSFLDASLLSEESIKMMSTKHNAKYGYGLAIINVDNGTDSMTIVGHEGEIFGYRSLIHMIPAENKFIIILDNHNNRKLFNTAKAIWNLKE
ncbi:serine hydrolase domain-containing protein [Labilibacter marinus]|uniref:serine hydrolase domain-containing protein n=1 Tax=Labilibacter marinus TaxID=1477105 RepID=UPI000837909C|nr:serine hydrolase domain-containing protein [Labilibacter marinus]